MKLFFDILQFMWLQNVTTQKLQFPSHEFQCWYVTKILYYGRFPNDRSREVEVQITKHNYRNNQESQNIQTQISLPDMQFNRWGDMIVITVLSSEKQRW
jgi:hypothetical protein